MTPRSSSSGTPGDVGASRQVDAGTLAPPRGKFSPAGENPRGDSAFRRRRSEPSGHAVPAWRSRSWSISRRELFAAGARKRADELLTRLVGELAGMTPEGRPRCRDRRRPLKTERAFGRKRSMRRNCDRASTNSPKRSRAPRVRHRARRLATPRAARRRPRRAGRADASARVPRGGDDEFAAYRGRLPRRAREALSRTPEAIELARGVEERAPIERAPASRRRGVRRDADPRPMATGSPAWSAHRLRCGEIFTLIERIAPTNVPS